MSSSTSSAPASRVLRGDAAAQLRPVALTSDLVASDGSDVSGVAPKLVERIRSQSEQEGYRAGLAAAEEELGRRRAIVQQSLNALANAVYEFDERQVQTAQDIENAVVEAAFQIAEAIVGRELQVAENPGKDAIVRALALAPEQGTAIVRLNPVDLATVATGQLPPSSRPIELMADPSVELGGCIVDVGPARIDAQLSSIIDRVREALL